MAQLAQAQFTLTDDTDIVISIEPPENATKDMLWLAVGQNPITLYRWSGVTGTLGSDEINSNNNYVIAAANTPLIVTNPNVDIGIYNMVGTLDTSVGVAPGWSIVVNQDTDEQTYNASKTTFSYENKYANLVCSVECTELHFNLSQGTLWCPAIDTNMQTSLSYAQQLLEDIMHQMNSIVSLTNQTILAPYQNGLQLYNYVITEHNGICFDPKV